MRQPSWFTAALLAVIAVLLTLLVVRQPPYPAVIEAAGVGNSGQAGSMIAVIGGSDRDHRLYLIDTEKKRICVYRNLGDRFRVVGMRTYRWDMEFDDSSLLRDIETGKGATATRIKALFNKLRTNRQ